MAHELDLIEKGSDEGLFDWVLQDRPVEVSPSDAADMIKQLIVRHNDMVDIINELTEAHNQGNN